jgi:hypothetical protein
VYPYAEDKTLEIDITLKAWADLGPFVFESEHGLKYENATYTYTYPGDCDGLELTFAKRSYKDLYVNDTYYYLPDCDYVVKVDGNTAEVQVYFDYDEGFFGFGVEKIKAKTDKPVSAVARLWTRNGQEDIVENMKATKELSASLVTGGVAPDTMLLGFAALYDQYGRFIGVAIADPVVSNADENASMHFTFDSVPAQAAEVRVMFTGSDFAPEGGSLGTGGGE